jgi:hypothetical protein
MSKSVVANFLFLPTTTTTFNKAVMDWELSIYGTIPSSNVQKLNHILIAITGSTALEYTTHEITVSTELGQPRSIQITNNSIKLVEKSSPEISDFGNYRKQSETVLPASDAQELMNQLKLEYKFETLCKGYQYQLDNIQIRLYRVYRVLEKLNVTVNQLISPNWVVQVLAPNCPQERLVTYSKQLFRLKAHLKDIVTLQIVDHTCLQQKLIR